MNILRGYRIFRHRVFDVAIVMSLSVLVVFQVWADGMGYPQNFRDRVQSEAALQIDDLGIKKYLEIVENLQTVDDLESVVFELYAPELYYSDTFMVAETRQKVLAHFVGLKDAGAQLDLEVHDVLKGDLGTYLVWSVDNSFNFFGTTKQTSSIGVTLFLFDEQGRILVQQDFWDSTEGFYQHLPVLGSALRLIRDQVGGS